jgi:hypothetical protein
MSSYVSSSDNRFYVALEPAYSHVGAVSGASRFPGVKLTARQEPERVTRKDKTGSRTFTGLPAGLRRLTNFDVRSYMSGWEGTAAQPGYGPLFQAALGGEPLIFSGGSADATATASSIRFAAAHGLTPGQAVAFGDEIRFVAGVMDAHTVQLTAPFSSAPAGQQLGAAITYRPGKELPSVSVFDYWGPQEAVHRVVSGAAVDKLKMKINGDFHEFQFSGPAADVIDSASFTDGSGNLTEFPVEPADGGANFAAIPGHMGQAWLGCGPDRCFTITEAELLLDNDVALRNREFGASLARGISPGVRTVTFSFSLYELTDEACRALYQAARQRSPISVMFQLGEQQGQLCGIYLKSVIPEVPEFDDSERRLEWRFTNCRAQGTLDDEIYIAFA